MKLIVLSAGALQITTLKPPKKSTLPSQFMSEMSDGALIYDKLRERSNRVNWGDLTGRIDWYDRRNNNLLWFTTAA